MKTGDKVTFISDGDEHYGTVVQLIDGGWVAINTGAEGVWTVHRDLVEEA